MPIAKYRNRPAPPQRDDDDEQKNQNQQDQESSENSSQPTNEPYEYEDDDKKELGCCRSCCGCCPDGPAVWWSNLNKLALAFFFIMFIICIIVFAGAGMPLFEKSDGSKLWSAWYYCYDVDTTLSNSTSTSSSGSTVISFFIGRSVTCVETHLANDIYICTEVQSRLNRIGALHICAFIFAIIALLTSIAHILKLLRFPFVPFLFSLLVMACAGAATAYSRDAWDDVLCPSTVVTTANENMYPLFNTSLSADSSLAFGDSWGTMAASTVLAAICFIVSIVMCFFPDGGPKSNSDETEDEEQNSDWDEQQQPNDNDGDDDDQEMDDQDGQVVAMNDEDEE